MHIVTGLPARLPFQPTVGLIAVSVSNPILSARDYKYPLVFAPTMCPMFLTTGSSIIPRSGPLILRPTWYAKACWITRMTRSVSTIRWQDCNTRQHHNASVSTNHILATTILSPNTNSIHVDICYAAAFHTIFHMWYDRLYDYFNPQPFSDRVFPHCALCGEIYFGCDCLQRRDMANVAAISIKDILRDIMEIAA